jgi:hypothetical protein
MGSGVDDSDSALPQPYDHEAPCPSEVSLFASALPTPVPTLDELEIEGNVGKIAPEKLRWMPSFPANTPDDVLCKEFETNGVVHVKGVIPRDYVLATRRK